MEEVDIERALFFSDMTPLLGAIYQVWFRSACGCDVE